MTCNKNGLIKSTKIDEQCKAIDLNKINDQREARDHV